MERSIRERLDAGLMHDIDFRLADGGRMALHAWARFRRQPNGRRHIS